MRVFPRLLLGHLAPVVVVSAALVLTLVALAEITAVLRPLNDRDLRALREESVLYRSCWALDVGLRHADVACSAGGDSGRAVASVQDAARSLRRTLRASDVGGGMRNIAHQWLDITDAVLAGSPCRVLAREGVRTHREHLDEALDEFWADRLDELRARLEQKDQFAQDIGDRAFTWGGGLALLAVGLALWIARRLARHMTDPLRSLASLTRRVGRGDFNTSIDITGPLEIVELAQDLERMRERLAELEALKQGFLASVSHELRTPLTKLRQALSLLRDGVVGPLSDEQQRVLLIASQACEREIRMVTTLLDLSRLRAGSPVQLRSGCSIPSIIEAAVEDERPEATTKHVTITVEIEGTFKPYRADPVLLERAIANLVRNAVSVSSKGQTVSLHCRETEHEGQTSLNITITDEGPGVPDDIRDSVFDAFVTRAVPRSPKTLGVGLGLALSREIAVAHGGDLTLDQAADVGTTFRLSLPRAPRPTEVKPNVPAPSSKSERKEVA